MAENKLETEDVSEGWRLLLTCIRKDETKQRRRLIYGTPKRGKWAILLRYKQSWLQDILVFFQLSVTIKITLDLFVVLYFSIFKIYVISM